MKAFARLAAVALISSSLPALAADEFSEAEQRVFIDHHLGNVKPGTVLSYGFHQTGGPEPGFDDQVKLVTKAPPNNAAGSGLAVEVDFLSGEHRLELPPLDTAQSNPVVLYFLEMDVRNMRRALGGQEAYFRKRIRMALAETAKVQPVTVLFAGHSIKASEVTIMPFADDPLKDRLKNCVRKRYVFTISAAVPGAIYRIETEAPADAAAGNPPAAPEHAVLTLDAG